MKIIKNIKDWWFNLWLPKHNINFFCNNFVQYEGSLPYKLIITDDFGCDDWKGVVLYEETFEERPNIDYMREKKKEIEDIIYKKDRRDRNLKKLGIKNK